jgi:hypothetical protein
MPHFIVGPRGAKNTASNSPPCNQINSSTSPQSEPYQSHPANNSPTMQPPPGSPPALRSDPSCQPRFLLVRQVRLCLTAAVSTLRPARRGKQSSFPHGSIPEPPAMSPPPPPPPLPPHHALAARNRAAAGPTAVSCPLLSVPLPLTPKGCTGSTPHFPFYLLHPPQYLRFVSATFDVDELSAPQTPYLTLPQCNVLDSSA